VALASTNVITRQRLETRSPLTNAERAKRHRQTTDRQQTEYTQRTCIGLTIDK